MWRVAVIGCGQIAGSYDDVGESGNCQTHAKACELLGGVELVAVCDPNLEKARAFAERWGGAVSFDNVEKMLTRSGADLVSICAPTGVHAELIEQCLDAESPRAVICEKPAGFDPGKLRALAPKFAASGKVFAVNYSRAYAPGIQKWRARLGELGGCVEATVRYGKGIFSYGSHAIQWLADWLGERPIVVAVSGAARGPSDGDPSVCAELAAGDIPIQLIGGPEDRFEVTFRCANGTICFPDYAYAVEEGGARNPTGLEMVMRDVFSNVLAAIDARPARVVGVAEAVATLEICAGLAKQAGRFL